MGLVAVFVIFMLLIFIGIPAGIVILIVKAGKKPLEVLQTQRFQVSPNPLMTIRRVAEWAIPEYYKSYANCDDFDLDKVPRVPFEVLNSAITEHLAKELNCHITIIGRDVLDADHDLRLAYLPHAAAEHYVWDDKTCLEDMLYVARFITFFIDVHYTVQEEGVNRGWN
jgi:hypothetical protein